MYAPRVLWIHHILVAHAFVMTRQDADQVEDFFTHDPDLAKVVRGLTTIELLGVLVQLKEVPRVVRRQAERRVRRLVAHEDCEGKGRFSLGGYVARDIESKGWVARIRR